MFVIILNFFSELWVKTYLDRAVNSYHSGRVKSNSEGAKSNMQFGTEN